MSTGTPLATSLSRLLIAFTIEFDNEFERQIPHFTTTTGLHAPPGAPAVWLVSECVYWPPVVADKAEQKWGKNFSPEFRAWLSRLAQSTPGYKEKRLSN